MEKALNNANRKIIVVIDDIDRLTSSQIRDIFQLVKQVADFPNVIYVLAMDREVVRSALREVHGVDGNEYLEKIIQVSFEIPELRRQKLHNILFAKLDEIVKTTDGEIQLDKYYWSYVFRNCIEPYIHTLRDINRLINTFQFRYGNLYQETCFEDMIAITTLEVLVPELYRWIGTNKNSVCGDSIDGLFSKVSNKDEKRDYHLKAFKELGIDPDLAISCVSTMFPTFAESINENQYSYQPTSNVRGKMRVAHKERFELYFMFDFDDIEVSRSIINSCIFELDTNELTICIERINIEGHIVYFLEEMRSLVDEIPYSRLEIIVSTILLIQGDFKGENSKSIFPTSAQMLADFFVNSIFKRFQTEDEVYSVIRSTLVRISKNGLGCIAHIINRIELGYGRLAANSEEREKQIVSLEQLQELEELYVGKISGEAKTEWILDINEFNMAFYLWRCFDSAGVKEFIDKLFKDKLDKLRFICATGVTWSGNNGNGWSFYSNNYSEYISRDEVYNNIDTLTLSGLNQFSYDEQIKLASFILSFGRNEMDNVKESEALELLSKWKSEI